MTIGEARLAAAAWPLRDVFRPADSGEPQLYGSHDQPGTIDPTGSELPLYDTGPAVREELPSASPEDEVEGEFGRDGLESGDRGVDGWERPTISTSGVLQGEQWSGTAEQVAFRDAVLNAHIDHSRRRKGPARPDLPPQDLRNVLDTGVQMAPRAAEAAGRLLASANRALAVKRQAGDADAATAARITGISGYRGRDHQARLWRRYFLRYYRETDSARQRLPGGRHSPAAIEYMLEVYGVPQKIAAPGYSNHQAGIAIDFLQVPSGSTRIRNSTRTEEVERWRRSWFFRWLQENAAAYGYQPYPKEPWHWEYRSSEAQREAVEPALDRVAESELDALAEDEQWGAEESEEPDVEAPIEHERVGLAQSDEPGLEQFAMDRVRVEEADQTHLDRFEQLSPLLADAEDLVDAALAKYRGIIAAWKGLAAGPALLSRTMYDRVGALDYARKFWIQPCDDQFVATAIAGRNSVKVPVGTIFQHDFAATSEYALLPDGSKIPWNDLDDCTHFISCCIGQRPGQPCGGLPITYRQLGSPPRAPYGIVRVGTMVDYLAGRMRGHPKRADIIAEKTQDPTLIGGLQPGDLIAYLNRATGRYSHMTMLLEKGKIACHTYCRSDLPGCTWDNDWPLGRKTHLWTFIRITA